MSSHNILNDRVPLFLSSMSLIVEYSAVKKWIRDDFSRSYKLTFGKRTRSFRGTEIRPNSRDGF